MMSENDDLLADFYQFSRNSEISYDASFDLASKCSRELRRNPEKAREVVIRIHDMWSRIPENTKTIWNDITESAGLYPYVDPKNLSHSALLRYEFHRSRFLREMILHEEQNFLSHELSNQRSVVVSAPTSFGKSLLIEEVVASRRYKNIVIVQPTLALIDETRRKLLKYIDSYKILLSTGQEASGEKGNIFLFTGERVMEYDRFPKVDFFVIDEFYKLSVERQDDRAVVLNQAFSKLLRLTSNFYMLGPMISSIPLSFQEKFQLTWYPTKFTTVAVNEIAAEAVLGKKITKKERDSSLNELLRKLQGQTIVYCSSPQKATERALDFARSLTGGGPSNSHLMEIRDWIRESVHEDWSLESALSVGVAFHHGALPRHLGASLVEEFNKGNVRFLFCTSTLIEGVNTTAKNVVLFDNTRGRNDIDFFDYRNIAGRSGRMRKHFVGNVIRFHMPPAQMEFDVDIPMFNQVKAPLEILVAMDETQIDSQGQERMKEFRALPEDLQALFRSNSGVSIDAQKSILGEIEANVSYYYPLLSWTAVPKKFDNLSAIVELGWKYLLGPGDQTYIPKVGRLTARWLASFAFAYINHRSIKAIISQYMQDTFWKKKIPDQQERSDVLCYAILHISRHWFDYRLPKWLAVVSNIQDYVFSRHGLRPGNYYFLASEIENSFTPSSFAALAEYDIPITTVKKLERFIDSEKSVDENVRIIAGLSNRDLDDAGLGSYERSKVHGLRKSV
jgi:hypothetical protein